MKKLQRYRLIGTTFEPYEGGEWSKHDDAMQALADRQAVVDVRTRERDRLLECVEVADRMRALLATLSETANRLVYKWDEENYSTANLGEEVTTLSGALASDDSATVAALYDDARKRSLAPRGAIDAPLAAIRELLAARTAVREMLRLPDVLEEAPASMADILPGFREAYARLRKAWQTMDDIANG